MDMRPLPLTLRPGDADALMEIAADPASPGWLIPRAEALLLASAGRSDQEIAGELGVPATKVACWRSCYARDGFSGIAHDVPRPTPALRPIETESDVSAVHE